MPASFKGKTARKLKPLKYAILKGAKRVRIMSTADPRDVICRTYNEIAAAARTGLRAVPLP